MSGGYDGPAELVTDAGRVVVEVSLRGAFQPIDGRYHWHGRVRPHDELVQWGRSGACVVVRTPEGEAEGRLSDEDPWGRFRVAGTGSPPFSAHPTCTSDDPAGPPSLS